MVRHVVCVLALFSCFAVPAQAQDWARKMFKTTDHNFGNVPRASTAQFYFELTNIYKEEVHIATAKSSCGCTDVQVTKQTLKTYEKGAVVAKFNTQSFQGQRSATLTVVIDKPFYAEVQLHVSGFIRTDLEITPPGAAFQSVDQGKEHERLLELTYTGRGNWSIEQIKVVNPNVDVEAKEVLRKPGLVKYQLKVMLHGSAPAGNIKEQILIGTNDRANAEIPLDLEAQILPRVFITPNPLVLGVVKPGDEVTKNLLIRGRNTDKKPFRIVAVECDNEDFDFKVDTVTLKTIHSLPVTFTGGDKAGKVGAVIRIRIEQGDEELVSEVIAKAEVITETAAAE